MNSPQPVKNAVAAIWFCIVMSAIAALIDRLAGRMSAGEFAFTIIFYGVMVMIPYKLARRSNVTRIVFAVLVAISVFAWLGGITTPLAPFSKMASIIQIPIVAVTLYWLFFASSATEWFAGASSCDIQESPQERIDPKL